MAKRLFWVICLFWGATSLSHATEHEVRAVGVKFDPMFIVVEPGDRVSWVNMPAHMIETIDAMVPEGTEKIRTELGVDVSFVFNEDGIYVYKCTPHWGARMGGVLLVGNPSDIEGTIDAYLAEIQKDKSLLPAKGLLKKFKKHLQKQGVI
ncbi:plastocyanin/azurin family copper-binding protein [Enterovibrio baiacu]|uniref:plastocyanin/azurin family copper-binding protein n=1 Tax=Enterovibrio baiacu TaxID=2491023 RepID=UPI001011EA93|nr:plastocyanin/azurin family copper-binding protein [Enterovibrio baiacu]MBE1276410.1 pseudoazurin [Enterovibrio baiacu]